MEVSLRARKILLRTELRAARAERSCETCDNALAFAHLNLTLCARRLEDELPPIAVERSSGACGPEGRHWKWKEPE